MKITREARLTARQIFRAFTLGGTMDESRLRDVVTELATQKPRNYLPILAQLQRLVAIWVAERTHAVETAVDLPDQGAAIFRELAERFNLPMATAYRVAPELIGGLRIRVGSSVWDGSVRSNLNQIQQALN
jgi:F-type H+-transporting ATPase subunit delta